MGVPASLFMEALELAQAFIGNPVSARATGVAVEREAGYVLLGSLCMCLPAEVLKVFTVCLYYDCFYRSSPHHTALIVHALENL